MIPDLIFDSFDQPVPSVRSDLQLIPVAHKGEQFLYIHDALGHVPPEFALNPQVERLLTFINGSFSIANISDAFQGRIDRQDLYDFIQLLDKNCLLNSAYFMQTAAAAEESFESSGTRPPVLAGNSYPEKPSDLNCFLNSIFSNSVGEKPVRTPRKALYAPHIDPDIGRRIYSSAFSTLGSIRPGRVVILATAHYAGYYPELYENKPFIGSVKDFQLPGGSVKTDKSYVNKLADAEDQIGFTLHDRAHRVEHSIELHLLFARHIWKHRFTIVPVLVNTFDELFYMPDGHFGKKLDLFSALLRELDDDDTFYLISGDLAHVGKKFGDELPAASMKNSVESFDHQFMTHAALNERDQLFRQIRKEYDPYRICGFPPLYTFLNSFPSLKGEKIGYHWWNETERESAVSFGAISY